MFWMVSILLLISCSSSLFSKLSGTVPNSVTTIGATVTFVFHIFLVLWQGQSICLSFQFVLFAVEMAKPTWWQVLLFLLINNCSGLLSGIRWSNFKSQRILCILFSRIDSYLCIYDLVVSSNFNLLHNSQLFTFPIQSYLVMYSFWDNLLYSFIMW